MRRLFTMMSDQVQVTANQLQTWWATLSPDPHTWVPFTWVLVGLVVAVLLALMIRPPRGARGRRPELLISHGELRVAAWAAPKVASSLKAPDHAAYELAMTVSNLSASPVQLLELAVRTNGTSVPTTAELTAVLPPHGAVNVSAELREAGGDEGVLDLFVYAPDMPPKTFRVRARLRWEPWNARYRVLPLAQRVDAVRGFGEGAQRRREASAWRREAGLRDPSRREAARHEEPWRYGDAPREPAAPRPPAPRPSASAYDEDGRFEPRPEFARPRPERARSVHESSPRPLEDEPESGYAPARPPYLEERSLEEPPVVVEGGGREGTPSHGTAPLAGAGERRHEPASYRPAPPEEATWPAAPPAREEHRARTSGRSAPASAPEDPRDALQGAPAVEDEDLPAPLAAEPRNGRRAGLGRAARAARGTERDGAEAAGGAAPPAAGRTGAQPETTREPERRRWAIRSEASAAETEPDLTEGTASGAERGARSRSANDPDTDLASVGERASVPASGEGDGGGREDGGDEGEGEERPRPRQRQRLEFPDEF